MTKRIRVRGTRRQEVDADRLAVAFLLLSKILYEQEQADAAREDHAACRDEGGEAARDRARS